MAYDIAGKVKLVNDAQTFGSGFEKREIVIIDESNSAYPQEIILEFVQGKVALLDDIKPGHEVEITFDIRGREYDGRYFNNLQGWKLKKIEAPDGESERPAVTAADTADIPAEDPELDVPF